ncbi:hypothetical protein LBMAG57_37530 [Verrucomicrobiota bacterium]|nr:hypothetical protein LBMAG57_37530 [Verrucomicrobiota bacterium]
MDPMLTVMEASVAEGICVSCEGPAPKQELVDAVRDAIAQNANSRPAIDRR